MLLYCTVDTVVLYCRDSIADTIDLPRPFGRQYRIVDSLVGTVEELCTGEAADGTVLYCIQASPLPLNPPS